MKELPHGMAGVKLSDSYVVPEKNRELVVFFTMIEHNYVHIHLLCVCLCYVLLCACVIYSS